MSKEAMKLALEALELAQDNLRDHGDNCFLHDEGEYNRCFCGKDSLSDHLQSVVEKLDEALNATLAEQPAQHEPVALPEKIYEFVPTPEPEKWHHPECEGECIACLIERVVQEAYGSQGLGYLQRHLTSPPAQREPLTDEEIWDEVKAADLDWQTGWSLDEDASNRYITLARAIEAAHGITGEKK